MSHPHPSPGPHPHPSPGPTGLVHTDFLIGFCMFCCPSSTVSYCEGKTVSPKSLRSVTKEKVKLQVKGRENPTAA